MRPIAPILIAILAVPLPILTPALHAQDDKPATNSDGTSAKSTKASEPAPPPDSTTQGAIDAGGQHIAYTAIAGTITVGATDTDDAQLGPDGKPLPGSQLALSAPKEPADAAPVAHMFYVAYFKTGANAEDRPITFFYNGGPGSSTMWLHMGSLGPKYVETAGDTHLPGAPYKLIDNADSLLDVSDEVFIDMPGTGFGRLAGKDAGKAFWGVDQDAEAFARFIARFLVKYGRWNSPKFLFGESYGTPRSAMLVNYLQKQGIGVNGVVLLSSVLDLEDAPPGKTLRDVMPLWVPEDAHGKTWKVWVGLWQIQYGGERVHLADPGQATADGDRVLAATFVVR